MKTWEFLLRNSIFIIKNSLFYSFSFSFSFLFFLSFQEKLKHKPLFDHKLEFEQVIILKFFSEIAGSRSLTTRKFLNFLLLFQYVPRILRVYISVRDLGRIFDLHTRVVWVKGAFNFFLYIIAGHVSISLA